MGNSSFLRRYAGGVERATRSAWQIVMELQRKMDRERACVRGATEMSRIVMELQRDPLDILFKSCGSGLSAERFETASLLDRSPLRQVRQIRVEDHLPETDHKSKPIPGFLRPLE